MLDLAPPEGYEPVFGFRLFPCPPRGLYMRLLAWVVDIGNDCLQAESFVRQKNYIFSAICAGTVTFTLTLQMRRTNMNPFSEVSTSIRQGRYTGGMWGFVLAEENIEAPVTGIVAPYGMALVNELDVVALVSSTLGILFSVIAMSHGQVNGYECSKASKVEIVRAIQPHAMNRVHRWYIIVFMSELSCLAIACAVLHPIIILPAFLVNLFANVSMHNFWQDADGRKPFKNLDKFPLVLILGRPPLTLLRLRCEADAGLPGQRLYILCATAVRILLWIALMLLVDLPHGVLACGTLGREMGFSRLQSDFLHPAHQLADTLQSCIQATFDRFTHPSADINNSHCAMQGTDHLSFSAMIFRSVLLTCAAICTPIYLLGSVLLLKCSGKIRNCEFDEELAQQVQNKYDEVHEWSQSQLNRHAQYSLLRRL